MRVGLSLVGWPTVSVLVASAASNIPSAPTVAGWLTAIGVGAGLGYAGWLERRTKADAEALERSTKARIEAQKAWDEANRDSLTAKLGAAQAERQDLSARVTALEAAHKQDQEFAAKLTEGIIKLSLIVGQQRGAVQMDESGEIKIVKPDGV